MQVVAPTSTDVHAPVTPHTPLRVWHRDPVHEPIRNVVTGGAGFIGSNLVDRLCRRGDDVVVLDDFSRPGTDASFGRLVEALTADGHRPPTVVRGDVADLDPVDRAIVGADVVYHLAGQVAVTTSIAAPLDDFRANALGTVHVLDAARRVGHDPIVVYASTNKVYGGLDGIGLEESDTRWQPVDGRTGIAEETPLAPATPYGCSKAAGEWYVRDAHATFGLRTVSLRQSCIVGPRQQGIEDQGWVSWMLTAARSNTPITVFGDGKQVRDVLDVDDLLAAYDAVVDGIDRCAGRSFNLGGGADRSMSVWAEFGPRLERITGRRPEVTTGPARPGDQRWFVADTSALTAATGWAPMIDLDDALVRIDRWSSRTEASTGRR